MEVEGFIIKSKKIRTKIIRAIEKKREMFERKDKFKRDIIFEYDNYGSKVYAPLTRDGCNPDKKPFKLEMISEYTSTFQGLTEMENELQLSNLRSDKEMGQLKHNYKTNLKKDQKNHLHAIHHAFNSIKKDEKEKLEKEERDRRREEKIREKERQDKLKDDKEEVIVQIAAIEEVIMLQKLLRGRREQNLMYEGKHKRAELIKELRSADSCKKAITGEDNVNLISDYIEKLTNGVVDSIQGASLSQTMDYLSKQMTRIKEEQKINIIVEKAEQLRRKREAEEMGRRQAEEILRDRQEEMNKEMLKIHQGTMDSYINSLIGGTVNKVSKNQVMKEIEIKANKLNKIVDKIESSFIKDNVTVRDLVSSFLLPEIARKKGEDKSLWLNSSVRGKTVHRNG